jgi:hypothetical protein
MLAGRRPTTDLEQKIVIDRNLLVAFTNRFWRCQGRRLHPESRVALDNLHWSGKVVKVHLVA